MRKARLPVILRNSRKLPRFSRARTGRRPGRYVRQPPMSRTDRSSRCRERRIFATPPQPFPERKQVSARSRNFSDYGPIMAFLRPRSRRMRCATEPSGKSSGRIPRNSPMSMWGPMGRRRQRAHDQTRPHRSPSRLKLIAQPFRWKVKPPPWKRTTGHPQA